MSDRAKANAALAMSTLAFFWCFACWTLNGVLGAFLVDSGVFHWNQEQLGWILGIPVLTGSVLRLPVGMLADRFGGKRVYTALLFLSAVPMWLLGSTHSYGGFLLASLGFGLTGASGYLFKPMAEAVMIAMIASFILSRTLVPTMAKYMMRSHHVATA